MMADGSVSEISLCALRHGERQSTGTRGGCFEHRIDQLGENSLRVLMLCEQYREDVNGLIVQFPSRRLETPLALIVVHWNQHAEVDRHIRWGNDGWSSEGDFGSTAIAKCCELTLDHRRRDWVMRGVFVGNDQFDHESFGVGLL